MLALLDPDADLTGRLEDDRPRRSWRCWGGAHRDLAEAFAGTAPAPGGAFRTGSFEDTPAGPRLGDAEAWADGRASRTSATWAGRGW